MIIAACSSKTPPRSWRMCDNSVAAAERARFKCLIISEKWTTGGPVPSTAASPAPSMVRPYALGMHKSPVSVLHVIGQIRQQTEAAVAAGFAGLLLLIDMSWLFNSPSGIALQGEFEASLQELMLGALPLRAVCLYHVPMFPEAMVLDAMRTHPRVRTTDGEFENPHFLSPRTFLSGDAAAKVDAWLNSLRPLRRPSGSRTHAMRQRALQVATKSVPNGSANPAAASNAAEAPTEPTGFGQRWKIRCLGNLRVYRHDGSAVQWSAANGATLKTKTLFAYLLHCGAKGANAEDIADLLWPQANDVSQSMNRLYHTVHCLRMVLSPELKSSRASPYVLGHDHHYHLSLPEGTWMDAPVFEQFCRRGEKLLQADQLEEALACHLAAEQLYTGHLLADIPTEYAQNVDRDWCWSRRYWLDEIYIKMLTQMCSVYRRLGNLERAIAYAENVLKLEPCCELAHQELMRIFHLSGRRDAIERQYRLCVGTLRRHEDRAPSANTRVLFHSLIS